MPKVFISYRRSDSMASTGRIADRLKSHFGEENIFHDVESIGLGRDFGDLIEDRLDETDIFLVVIGDAWLDARDDEGNRRIDDPKDWVHMEIARALARGKDVPVVPVLVGTSESPPTDQELPPQLEQLNNRHAIVMRSDATFDGQMQRLIQDIERIGGGGEARRDVTLEPAPVKLPEAPAAVAAPKKSRAAYAIGALLLVGGCYLALMNDDIASVVIDGDTMPPVAADATRQADPPRQAPAMEPAQEEWSPPAQQPTMAASMPDVCGGTLAEARSTLQAHGIYDFSWEFEAEGDVPDEQVLIQASSPPPGGAMTGEQVVLYGTVIE